MDVDATARAPVLVIGATGLLGRQVVPALQRRGRSVRALVRPGSDATALEATGVEVIRGDMLDPGSLDPAFAGVDAVVTSAVGYTRRRSSDTAATDTAGNQHLADAAARAGVRRYVFTGILRADEAGEVPHFWHKVLAERALAERAVPYVSLRPGAFFDQVMDLVPGGGVRSGWLLNPSPPDVRVTYVLSSDVAEALAALVDADVRDGEHVELGWDRPVSPREVAPLAAAALGRRVRLLSVPQPLVRGGIALASRRSQQVSDLGAMLRFFASGRYVADTTRQRQLFGTVPTAEEAIGAWAARPPLQR